MYEPQDTLGGRGGGRIQVRAPRAQVKYQVKAWSHHSLSSRYQVRKRGQGVSYVQGVKNSGPRVFSPFHTMLVIACFRLWHFSYICPSRGSNKSRRISLESMAFKSLGHSTHAEPLTIRHSIFICLEPRAGHDRFDSPETVFWS